MEDRKLLQLAARAAGYLRAEHGRTDGSFVVLTNEDGDYIWNPLTDDGDALRLAVKLNLDVFQAADYKEAQVGGALPNTIFEQWGEDKLAATRRAIVRAAAAIGEKM